MKLAKFLHNGHEGLGLVSDDGIISLPSTMASPAELGKLLDAAGWRQIQAFMDAPADFKLSDATLLPPLCAAARVFCVGLNYKSHVDETNSSFPEHPALFMRTHESFVGHGTALRRPRVSDCHDFEGELAVLIGRACHRVSEESALDYVGGYSCCNEGSIRDYQKHSPTGMTGKNFDASGALGPWIVSPDEIPEPEQLSLLTRLNGETMQEASTSQLIYGIGRVIAYLSECLVLRPGDVIATGTPSGVGARRTPPRWLAPGDRIEVSISGIGSLSNPVEDEQ